MKLKHAIMISMLGRLADRFHEYHAARDLTERLELASQVDGMDGIEVVYPNDFEPLDTALHTLKESGMPISALNLNVKGQKIWEYGSFTARDPQVRARAVQELKTALDLAAELGTGMVSCCPLIDGHNYSFEVDYLHQWEWLVAGLQAGASHRQDIRLSLEYKRNESRNYNLLSDVGRTLYLCEQIGFPHVGITVDIGHALIASETPAEALALAAQAGRLFYVHFNDNGREWDWDMLPASVNFWDTLETLFYLHRLNWEGWLSYDVVARGDDLKSSMAASISIIKLMESLMGKIGTARLQGLLDQGRPSSTFETLIRAMLR
jgi:xylose isomerase